jgi:hypothetical protein
VCASEGNIDGLEFDFGDGFPLDLGLGLPATITYVEVKAWGQETAVVIPPKQFIYNANLSEGGLITADAILYVEDVARDVTLEFEFGLANIFEQFKIKKKDISSKCEDLLNVTAPKKVDLFFEVTDAQLIGISGDISGVIPKGFDLGYVPPTNLVLVIDKGKPALVETFKFPIIPESQN